MIKDDTTTPDEEKDVEITVEEASEEVDYKSKYLHLLADSENARKRLQKDRDEIVQYSLRSLLQDFLSPIDHMENALNYTGQASEEVQNWAKGFQMILAQFKDVLASNNVKSFESVGKPFDPHIHDAVEMKESAEHPPGTVLEETMKGYLIGDKTLRPARVVVSKVPVEELKEKEDKEVKS
ncbi:protein grpE [Waddlia chondrophila 2032/99]|uniref:Protein GrpE n=2 Tax=Waddlia chondrophila TaxID=71667 RepID=D6YSD7_WADCW|nr:nucleotide exchange factor GrpE [Waddlia chondrophila]ADI38982.1 putative molecular chaperone grpE (HSP-70 cofactor) [Waddlia chondrophila WSU 86-1044]CCB92103.1 protein grpE [Waddlia chondrophila 2032/99]